MNRNDIVLDAHAWIGTPYVHQASKRGVGSDCIGMIAGIARDRNTPEGIAWSADPQFKGYARTPDPRLLLSGCRTYLQSITILEAQPADILLMRFIKEPQHFALLVEIEPVPYIIHASSQHGKVVKNRLDDRWRSRVVRAFSYKDVK